MKHPKPKPYSLGDCLCDMHYGFKNLPGNLEVVSHIQLRHDEAHNRLLEFTFDAVKGFAHNKLLYIVGNTPLGNLVAMYHYDNHILGTVELRYKE